MGENDAGYIKVIATHTNLEIMIQKFADNYGDIVKTES